MGRGIDKKYGQVVLAKNDNTPLRDGEAVFVLRGSDGLAPAAIRAYIARCLEAGLEEHARSVETALHEFEDWQASNHEFVKMPDTPTETAEEFE